MTGPVPAGDRVTLLGEFADADLEGEYRRQYAPQDLAVARVVVCTGGVATLGLGFIDHQLFPGGPELVGLGAARGAVFAASAAALVLLGSAPGPVRFARVLCGWFAATVALHVYVGAVWPAGHVELRMTAALSALMSYCVLPLTLRLQTTGALLHTAGSLAVVAWLNPPAGSAAVVGEACWLGVVNALGLVLSFRQHTRQRQLFAAHLRQSQLTTHLARALAEVRTLRGLIRVCAWCRKVNGDGGWQMLEAYVREHSHAEFTHGICPACLVTAME